MARDVGTPVGDSAVQQGTRAHENNSPRRPGARSSPQTPPSNLGVGGFEGGVCGLEPNRCWPPHGLGFPRAATQGTVRRYRASSQRM